MMTSLMCACQSIVTTAFLTLPTDDLDTLKLTQINNFDLMSSCPTLNLRNQHMRQQESQPQPGTTTTAPFVSATTEQLTVDHVMPGICLSKNFIAWNEQNLRLHGFTHIIRIDKHIQELYYPSPMLKFCADEITDFYDDCYDMSSANVGAKLQFSKEFEAIDLNFGEKSYLTTVLPNCYRAVKFINKALQAGGTILVIDCNGGEQKCLTIVVAFLMYKNNISFSDAFSRLKSFYNKADLDRFYTSQLYEYEPILQVQRAQACGHSCSRELHAAQLKRKQIDEHASGITQCADKFLDTLNPLTQFHTPQQQQHIQQQLPQNRNLAVMQQHQKILLTPAKSSTFHDWYSYVMD